MANVEYRILNHAPPNMDSMSCSPSELALELQRTMLCLKGDHMTEDGRGVNYSQLGQGDVFKEYVSMTGQLWTCDPSHLEEGERKAFFINIYNALTIHGLASEDKLPASVLEVGQFWKRTAYNIGGHILSLDDIEHGILRGNKPHPSSSEPLFPIGDSRMMLTLQSCEPRVHFTLVCGAKSCPAIQVYSAKNIERGLDQAARSFCEQEVEIVMEAGQVEMSKIFSWYACDFGATERELLQWITKFLSDFKQEQLTKLLCKQEPIGISYREYNWQLNKQ